MKKSLLIFILLPLFTFAQQPKPKTTTKPKPATTATKPATGTKPQTAAKPTQGTKPKTTTGTTPKKPNPAVTKLVEKAYEQYKATKDKECEATIKQILALDPKNKDAYMLRANMAMFAGKMDEMWKNLNIIYKYYPKEPDIYSQFAVNHLTYTFLSDSVKRVLCRKTIKLASNYGEGYASLGLVAAVGGYYEEAVTYFDISFKKQWKDTNSKTILKLPYARCLYEMGDKEGSIRTISELIPKLKGEDKYTCIYMRATYKMENGEYDVKDDIDTMLAAYPNDIGVKKLQLTYLKKTGSDTLCPMAKEIRENTEGNDFDISPYCNDLTGKLNITKGTRFIYDIKGSSYIIEPTDFNFKKQVDFNWYRGSDEFAWDTGIVTVTSGALDSAILQQNYFYDGHNDVLQNTITVWLSKKQFNEVLKDSVTKIATDGVNISTFRLTGHEQMEVLNSKNAGIMLDCIRLFDGEETILFLNDPENPLIVKLGLKTYSMILTKFE